MAKATIVLIDTTDGDVKLSLELDGSEADESLACDLADIMVSRIEKELNKIAEKYKGGSN